MGNAGVAMRCGGKNITALVNAAFLTLNRFYSEEFHSFYLLKERGSCIWKPVRRDG